MQKINDSLNGLVGEILTGVKVPGLRVKSALAVQGAPRYKERHPNAGTVSRVKFT